MFVFEALLERQNFVAVAVTISKLINVQNDKRAPNYTYFN